MALAGCPDSFLHRPYYQVWGSVGGCRLHGQWLRATAQMELVTAIHSVTGCGWTGAAGTSRRGSHVCHGCLHLVLRGLSPVLSVRGLSPVLSVRGTLSSSSLLLLCGFACDPRDGVFRGGRLLGPRAQVAGAVAPSGTSSGGTASWARSGERVGSGPRRGLSEMESPPPKTGSFPPRHPVACDGVWCRARHVQTRPSRFSGCPVGLPWTLPSSSEPRLCLNFYLTVCRNISEGMH